MNETMTPESLDDLMKGARDSMSVRRVFGDPITNNGITVIPAARIAGGGGGGGGEDGQHNAKGMGAGFGTASRPAGMFVVKGDTVTWEAATDRNLRAVLITVVLAFAISTVRLAIKLLIVAFASNSSRGQ